MLLPLLLALQREHETACEIELLQMVFKKKAPLPNDNAQRPEHLGTFCKHKKKNVASVRQQLSADVRFDEREREAMTISNVQATRSLE